MVFQFCEHMQKFFQLFANVLRTLVDALVVCSARKFFAICKPSQFQKNIIFLLLIFWRAPHAAKNNFFFFNFSPPHVDRSVPPPKFSVLSNWTRRSGGGVRVACVRRILFFLSVVASQRSVVRWTRSFRMSHNCAIFIGCAVLVRNHNCASKEKHRTLGGKARES